jgi:hypothetical protein
VDDAERYIRNPLDALEAASWQGHSNPDVLRGLLIGTTHKGTFEPVMSYFRKHLLDRKLLSDLAAIALAGEDNGDAPWAAANVITEFPAELLKEIEPELIKLSNEQWMYLCDPANEALAKIRSN